LTQIKAASRVNCFAFNVWQKINSSDDIPADRDVRLAVIDAAGTVHALVFACRRVGNSFVDAKLRRPVEVYPTHWQEWAQESH
jgi:hypothetical protein